MPSSKKASAARRQALSAKSRKKPSKSGTAKRRKPETLDAIRDLPTPFVSALTGRDYKYTEDTSEPFVYLTCTPTSNDCDIPPEIGDFLRTAALSFASSVEDVLFGPDYLVLIVVLNPDHIATYYKFCTPGLIKVPGTLLSLQIKALHMAEMLQAYGFDVRNPEDFQEDDDFPMTSSDDSSSSEERQRIPPAKVNEITTPVSQPCPTLVTEKPNRTSIPAAEKRQETSSQSAPQPPAETGPISMETDAAIPSTSSSQLAKEARPVSNDNPDNVLENDAPTPTAVQTSKPTQPRRVRPVYRAIDFQQLIVDVPKHDFQTVLFRPVEPGTSLHRLNPFKVNSDCEALGATVQSSRCIRDGGLALDFLPDAKLDPLLAMLTLAGINVSTHLPLPKHIIQGVLCGVHWEIPEAQIREELRTVPQTTVRSVQRMAKPGQESWTVKVTFEADQLPDKAFLAGRSHRIRPYQARPLQCFRCGLFGHAARVCRSKQHCWTCSGEHSATDCPNKATPKCRNCGDPHPADSPTCKSRLFQQKVADVKARENVPFKVARTAVTKAVRSYASALKGPTQPAINKPPVGGNKPAATEPKLPNFKPNTPHLRPPMDPTTMTSLFKSLISILAAAAASTNFAGAMEEILRLFQSTFPGAESLFSLPI